MLDQTVNVLIYGLFTSTAHKLAKAKVHVYSDSVFCLGKMHEHSEANVKCKDQLQCCQESNGYRDWNAQLEEFRQSNSYRELFGIDGEPIEFEWHIFRGLTTLQTLPNGADVQRVRRAFHL